MAFSDQQSRALKAKLDSRHVKKRQSDNGPLHYIEGWHAIAEANRIFGFEAWDRRTLTTRCVWTGTSEQYYLAAYTAKVRIRVRAGDTTVVRDGSGTGEGRALTPGQAHEKALKSAETDATKRALTTFGNPFGLALYDREQSQVRRSKSARERENAGPWTLRSTAGDPVRTFRDAKSFGAALAREMSHLNTIETLFALWEQNLATVRAVNDALKRNGVQKSDFAKDLVAHLKSCAVTFANGTSRPGNLPKDNTASRLPAKVDKSVLALSEPKRQRSKEHLRYVARQACLICGRSPSHAHHVRFAQPRGLGLKVSDEFTVPLCAIHHTENHGTGDERRWWVDHNVDPLPVAERLWRESRL